MVAVFTAKRSTGLYGVLVFGGETEGFAWRLWVRARLRRLVGRSRVWRLRREPRWYAERLSAGSQSYAGRVADEPLGEL
jgi:hypothetical protein